MHTKVDRESEVAFHVVDAYYVLSSFFYAQGVNIERTTT